MCGDTAAGGRDRMAPRLAHKQGKKGNAGGKSVRKWPQEGRTTIACWKEGLS